MPMFLKSSRHAMSCTRLRQRGMSTQAVALRRSYLYVPSSSTRMLEKSLSSNSDVIIYDLEDSVSPSPVDKRDARARLTEWLSREDLPNPQRVAVRLNDVSTPFFKDDIQQIASLPTLQTLVLPKIHSAEDLHRVSDELYKIRKATHSSSPLNIVSSVESAKASWNLGDIARWKSHHGDLLGGRLSALLFAAEDYCADTSIIRTPARQELLYARSKIVTAAKAFGLEAIDMVCVDYKDLDYLRDECRDGRQLGFTGKQAIHPSQVDVIQSTFVPTSEEILRAAKIIHSMTTAHSEAIGAVGLDGEMIDAPMLKQAENTIRIARKAGLEVPSF